MRPTTKTTLKAIEERLEPFIASMAVRHEYPLGIPHGLFDQLHVMRSSDIEEDAEIAQDRFDLMMNYIMTGEYPIDKK